MTTVFQEGRLRFSFGDAWRVEKYDEHRGYRQRLGKLGNTRAVDFVGCHENKTLFLIEVKDFRGHRIENKDRLHHGMLAQEIAWKARDTLPGLIAAHRARLDGESWEPFVSALTDPACRLSVVLWLEEDRPSRGPWARRRTVARGTLTKQLKRKLRWLTTHIAVLERGTTALPDVEIEEASH